MHLDPTDWILGVTIRWIYDGKGGICRNSPKAIIAVMIACRRVRCQTLRMENLRMASTDRAGTERALPSIRHLHIPKLYLVA